MNDVINIILRNPILSKEEKQNLLDNCLKNDKSYSEKLKKILIKSEDIFFKTVTFNPKDLVKFVSRLKQKKICPI